MIRPSEEIIEKIYEKCRDILGERISNSAGERRQHGQDLSAFGEMWPDLVAFPKTTDEVAQILKICYEHDFPVIPYGAASSLEGHILAPFGGLTVDLSQMDRIVEISPEDMTATVEAGVSRKSLNAELGSSGLFFAIDPGADASIGGMCATRASGTAAVRYGTMRDNVLRMRVVLADGRIIETGTYAKKSAAGYDLTGLFVGSEGTLGIITEATVRLHPIAESMIAATSAFSDTHSAIAAVQSIIMMGISLGRCEFVDKNGIRAINQDRGLGLLEKPYIFLEFQGDPATTASQSEIVQEIILEHGGENFEVATKKEDCARIWSARHHAFFAISAMKTPSRVMITDACVPISRLGDCLSETEAELEASGLPFAFIGHVGDGNFHAMILLDPDDSVQGDQGEALANAIADRAIRMGGTCTGEHGIGMHKIAHLEHEFGASVEIMRAIKQALDPKGIMNPGKIFAHR